MATEKLQICENTSFESSPRAHFLIKENGYLRRLELSPTKTTIGRNGKNDLSLSDTSISAEHLEVQLNESNHFVIKDKASSNGTYVNGTRIKLAQLEDGDRVQAGQTELIFQLASNSNSYSTHSNSKNIKWQKQLDLLPYMGRSNHPVLISGPSGSGKEGLANMIHRYSPRKYGPFVSVNCSALSESLVESELFGHIKGSFTGATTDRQGAFQAAKGGTLFLDEIGDLPLSIQPKILRALENSEIKPVGSDQILKTNVRIVSATHHNLQKLVQENRFRQDLFFRLQVLQLNPPSLKDRLEDFEDILDHICKSYGISLDHEGKKHLMGRKWDGNIRELKNLIARASTFYPKSKLSLEQVRELTIYMEHRDPIANAEAKQMPVLKEIERQLIFDRLLSNRGNQRLTATELGMPKSTLHDRIKAYGINVDQIRKRSRP